MRAVYISEFGDIENLEVRDISEPAAPLDSQVLVRVKAAGLNRADLLQIRGSYPPPDGYSSNIPGLEFAGEVAAVGAAVSSWNIGDRVFGIAAGEAQAEYLLSNERILSSIPLNLSFAEAAAVPEAFITAHDALVTRAGLKAGETVLIHAVGSGVGLAALQIAKAKRGIVVGTSRTSDKLERCMEFGLDAAVETGANAVFAEEVAKFTGRKGVDIILDLVGAAYFKGNLASMGSKGRLILVGLTSGATSEFDMRIALHKRLTIIGTVLRARSLEEKADATRAFTSDVLPLISASLIQPNLDRAYSADNVIEAYKYLGSNESFGKVVLEF